eukprot:10453083-Karenia_brevis.AAC.1
MNREVFDKSPRLTSHRRNWEVTGATVRSQAQLGGHRRSWVTSTAGRSQVSRSQVRLGGHRRIWEVIYM